jgi:hypothetical protein
MCQVLGLMPVILATQEAEIKRIMVGGQPGQKNPTQNLADRIVQVVQHLPITCPVPPKKKYIYIVRP